MGWQQWVFLGIYKITKLPITDSYYHSCTCELLPCVSLMWNVSCAVEVRWRQKVLCGKPETYILQLPVAFLHRHHHHHHQCVSMIEVSNFCVIHCHHFCSYTLLFLFRHVHNIVKSDNYLHHVRLFTWNKLACIGWISRKLILRIVRKSFEKIQVWLKSDKHNRYFT